MSAGYFPDIEWKDAVAITGNAYGVFDAPCPVCSPDRKPANRSAKIFRLWRSVDDCASYNCVHCGLSGVVFRDPLPDATRSTGAVSAGLRQRTNGAAEERARLERAAKVDEETRLKSYEAEFTFFSAGAVEGTPAETYLASRGLRATGDLRYSPFVPYGERTAPAMVAAVRDPGGRITAIERTFLTPDGQKRKRLSFGPVGQGAVRLAPIGPERVLAVAEGTEDALAFTVLYELPCWSALGKGGIRRFQIPDGLERLVIAADNDVDGGGLDAAHDLAKRAREHCDVEVRAPAKVKDWNDVLRGLAA